MKAGDLVRHRFDGRWDEVGVILKITNCTGVHPGGMASVLWSPSCMTHNSDRMYRTRDLETINESR